MKRFGYAGKPETCLWCGRPLAKKKVLVELGYVSTCCDASTTEEAQRQPAPSWLRSHSGEDLADGIAVYRCDSCGEQCNRYQKYGYSYPGERTGYAGSKHFCTLRCGYAFAETVAENGTRLQEDQAVTAIAEGGTGR